MSRKLICHKPLMGDFCIAKIQWLILSSIQALNNIAYDVPFNQWEIVRLLQSIIMNKKHIE